MTVNGETRTVDRTASVIDSDRAGESRPLLSKVVGGAAAAYSLRDLNDKQGNNKVVRVRRSSDNAERDFLAKELSNAELITWVGSGNDGRVQTWYDQSGNDNHATQTTTSFQALIVSSGSLVSNGLDFQSDTYDIPTGVISNINSVSAFVVAKSDTTSGSRTGLALSRNNPDFRFYNPIIVSSNFNFGYQDSAAKISLGSADTNKHLFTAIAGSSNAEAFLDGTSKGTVSSADGINALSSGGIGSINDGVVWDGKIQEIIIYNSDQTANRPAIEANIANQYGITLS
jgi:hypothetical protein